MQLFSPSPQPDRPSLRETSGGASWSGLPSGLPAAVSKLAADPALSDAELVRRTLAGQHDPFAALVARYQKRPRRSCDPEARSALWACTSPSPPRSSWAWRGSGC
jgi:hypothetical protein